MTQKTAIRPEVKPAPAAAMTGKFYIIGQLLHAGYHDGIQWQYLHQDGIWRRGTLNEKGEYTGYFESKEEALEVMARCGPPLVPANDPPATKKCPKCDHISWSWDKHICPNEEYLKRRDTMISDALNEGDFKE